MDIEESIYIIADVAEEYFENRMFNIYVTCVDKEKFGSYEDYKNINIKKEVEKEEIDVEERKKEAEKTLKRFMEGGM